MLVRVFVLSESGASERRLLRVLERLHAHIAGTSRGHDFWEQLGRTAADVVVAELAALPPPAIGAVRALRQIPEPPEVIVVSGEDDPQQRAELHSAGAMAVLFAGLSDAALRDTLGALVQRSGEETLKRRHHHPGVDRASEVSEFISRSPAMAKLVETARRVAAVDASLLILGETGVGKERLAKSIHASSPRARGPFVAVNCAAIPESLLESELFGHEQGAFTGAHRARRGHFELAHRGTLFLDEVGDMSPATQVKLLRALQERCIQPVGGEHQIDVDVRIMAATNRDLQAELAARRFREDLYYRLGVVTLTVPPLRERREDIPQLVDHYRAQFAQRLRRPVVEVTPAAMQMLVAYDWPGNVRELVNVIEHATILCQGNTIGPSDLPDIRTGTSVAMRPDGHHLLLEIPTVDWARQPWHVVREGVLRAAERHYLEVVLRDNEGRVGVSAARAGISARSLSRKMRSSGLRKEQFHQDRE